MELQFEAVQVEFDFLMYQLSVEHSLYEIFQKEPSVVNRSDTVYQILYILVKRFPLSQFEI